MEGDKKDVWLPVNHDNDAQDSSDGSTNDFAPSLVKPITQEGWVSKDPADYVDGLAGTEETSTVQSDSLPSVRSSAHTPTFHPSPIRPPVRHSLIELLCEEDPYHLGIDSDDALARMPYNRPRRPMRDSQHEQENLHPAVSSLSSSTLSTTSETIPLPESNASSNVNANQENMREVEDTNNKGIFHGAFPVTEQDLMELPTSPSYTGNRVWGRSNRPGSFEFTIYEDPPKEDAILSVPCPLAEGFHSVEEDKENLLVSPFEHVSSSSDEEVQPFINWTESAHRPRDAFGGPFEYTSLPRTNHTFLDTEGVYFRRGRHVLAPLAIPDAEDYGNEDTRVGNTEFRATEEFGESDQTVEEQI